METGKYLCDRYVTVLEIMCDKSNVKSCDKVKSCDNVKSCDIYEVKCDMWCEMWYMKWNVTHLWFKSHINHYSTDFAQSVVRYSQIRWSPPHSSAHGSAWCWPGQSAAGQGCPWWCQGPVEKKRDWDIALYLPWVQWTYHDTRLRYIVHLISVTSLHKN